MMDSYRDEKATKSDKNIRHAFYKSEFGINTNTETEREHRGFFKQFLIYQKINKVFSTT